MFPLQRYVIEQSFLVANEQEKNFPVERSFKGMSGEKRRSIVEFENYCKKWMCSQE